MRKLLFGLLLLSFALDAEASHTYYSLFRRSDSLQVREIRIPESDGFMIAGHHGPALENQYMCLRLYFNASGAIDVYSKNGRVDNELGRWKWYPGKADQLNYGAGSDDYLVGKTTGLGGVRLWDGEKEVLLEATKGRRAVVGRCGQKVFMKMYAYGVPYMGRLVDIMLKVEMKEGSRWATVSAKALNGEKVRFATGVNFHRGALWDKGEGYLAVWGVHPSDVALNPGPIGAGMRYNPEDFTQSFSLDDRFLLVSGKCSSVQTYVVAASEREDELCNPDAFFSLFRR